LIQSIEWHPSMPLTSYCKYANKNINPGLRNGSNLDTDLN